MTAPASQVGPIGTNTRRLRLDPRRYARSAWLRVRPAWRLPLLVFLWCQLVLLAWWAGQWPGLLSPDSIRYILHVTTGPWTADHSVVYDSLVLLSLTLTHNIALLTFVQTTVASAIVAFCVSSIHAFGVRARWAIIPAILLPLVPSFGAFVSTVWKDVPFALTEMLVAATTLRLVAHRRRQSSGERTVPRNLLISLAVELIALTLFRNDGFVMVIVVAVVLAIALSGLRVKILAIGLAALAVFFVCEAAIYPAAGIKKAQSSLAYGTFYADIAVAYAEAPHTFTAADRALMTQVAPLSSWRNASNCYYSDTLFKKPFSLEEADRLKGSLTALYFRTLKRTPVLVVRTHLCRAAVGWNPFPPPANRSSFGEVVQQVPKSLYATGHLVPRDIAVNLLPDPLSTKLGKLTHSLRLAGYEHRVVQVLFFRGATWSYILYLVLFVAVRRRRRWDLLAVGAMSLANQLSVIAANPAQLYRYMVGPIFIGMLFVPMVLARGPAETDGVPHTTPVEPEEPGQASPSGSPASDAEYNELVVAEGPTSEAR